MAMDAERSNFTVQSIEQIANFQGRWAVKCWKESRQEIDVENDSAKDIEFLQKLDQAIALLNKLCQFGFTGERLSLLGSAYKHKAWVTTGQERKKALVKMSGNYMRAYELSREKTDMIDPYPLLNWLTGKLVLGWFEQSQNEQSKQEFLIEMHQSEAVSTACRQQLEHSLKLIFTQLSTLSDH